jgi:hypothetical protein
MYSYNAICEDDTVLLSPTLKTIKALRARYFRNREMFEDQGPVTEIVVFKGSRIHGYYTSEFKLDRSKPADIHNIFYGRV